jgi:hypothetical protein
VSSPTSPAAGWYADPRDATIERYWDGDGWTAETRQPPRSATQVADAADPEVRGGARTVVAVGVVAAVLIAAGAGAFVALRGDPDPPRLVTAESPDEATDPVEDAEDVEEAGAGEAAIDEVPDGAEEPTPADGEGGAPSPLEDLPELTDEQRADAALDDALQAVLDAGDIPTDRYSFDLSGTLQVIVATVPGGGESAHVFVDGERIGRDLLDPSHRIEIADVGPTAFVLQYAVFADPSSDRCCPDAVTTVEYVWDGDTLSPLDDIPSSDPADRWARN